MGCGETNLRIVDSVAGGDVEGSVGAEGSGDGGEQVRSGDGAERRGAEEDHGWYRCC